MTFENENYLDYLSEIAVKRYGNEKQLEMVVEECSELIKAIMKWKRNDIFENVLQVLEEYVDVKITLNQIKYIFPLDREIEKRFRRKLERLRVKLQVGF
jgi:uncharacterized protein YbcI